MAAARASAVSSGFGTLSRFRMVLTICWTCFLSALVGYGRADKKQVQQMVKTILNLDKVPKPDDTADALAAAICHGHSSGGASGKRELRIRKGI